MRLFITRPREDAAPLAERLRAAGHEVLLCPVLEIVPRGVAFPAGPFQAACVTSANGVRCLEGAINPALRVFAVGAQSAAAARARGFREVMAEGGDVEGLARVIKAKALPEAGALLYISGSETSGDLAGALQAAGFPVTRLITYDAVAQKLDEIAGCFREGDGVLLYSPRSALLWAAEITRLGLAKVARHVTHFCLSAQVAAKLPQDFPRLVAQAPTEKSLLALLDLAGEAE